MTEYNGSDAVCPPLLGQKGHAASTLFAGTLTLRVNYPPCCACRAVWQLSHMKRPWVGAILGSPSLGILLGSARLVSEQAFR